MWLSLLPALALVSPGDRAPSPAARAGAAPRAVLRPHASTAERPRASALVRLVPRDVRGDALQRARVWRRPSTPIGRAALAPRRTWPDPLACRYLLTPLGGTTPKFDCVLDDGTAARVKYGRGAEIHAEVATTALLRTLGFGADTVLPVETLRCHGCPPAPFQTTRLVNATRTGALLRRVIDERGYEDFQFVALERRFPAVAIETPGVSGWGFFELDRVDAARGGAPRAHVDALRLMAVLLAHWDNKVDNQRLVCLAGEWPAGAPCPEPFLLLQDVGATFGPRKVDFARWRETPVWKDRDACLLSMHDMPHRGSTFADVQVTDAGRRHLASLLTQLTESQLTALFTAARFHQIRAPFTSAAPVSEWVRAFMQKVAAIREGPACPSG